MPTTISKSIKNSNKYNAAISNLSKFYLERESKLVSLILTKTSEGSKERRKEINCIAKVLGVTPQAVYRRISRAKELKSRKEGNGVIK